MPFARLASFTTLPSLFLQARPLTLHCLFEIEEDVYEQIVQEARGFARKGSDTQASQYYGLALEIAEKNNGIDSEQAVICLVRLAKYLCFENKTDRALGYLEKAKAILGAHPEYCPVTFARYYHWLAKVYYRKGQPALAREHLAQSNHFWQLALQKTDTAIQKRARLGLAKAHSDEGNLLLKQGKYKDALKIQREVIEDINEIEPHKDKGSIAWIYGNLGNAYKELRHFSQAEKELDTANAMRERLFREGHPALMPNKISLAEIYIEQGQLDKAEVLLKEAEKWRRHVKGGSDRIVAAAYYRLGIVFECRANYQEAKLYFAQALKIDKRTPNKNTAFYEIRDRLKHAEMNYHLNEFDTVKEELDIINDLSKNFSLEDNFQNLSDLLEIRVLLRGSKTDLHSAIALGSELFKRYEFLLNEAIAQGKVGRFDALDYSTILQLLHEAYLRLGLHAELARLYLEKAREWYKYFPHFALRWIDHGLAVVPSDNNLQECNAQLYELKAKIAHTQCQYHDAIRDMSKAVELNQTVERKASLEAYETQLTEDMTIIDEDIYAQLQSAQETYHKLQRLYIRDLTHSGCLSESVQNRTTELLIKLGSVLDMAYLRWAKETVFARDPERPVPRTFYYPFGSSKKSLEKFLRKDQRVILEPRITITELYKMLVHSQKDRVNNLLGELKERGYLDANGKISSRKNEGNAFFDLSPSFDPWLEAIKKMFSAYPEGTLINQSTLGQRGFNSRGLICKDKKKSKPAMDALWQQLINQGYLELVIEKGETYALIKIEKFKQANGKLNLGSIAGFDLSGWSRLVSSIFNQFIQQAINAPSLRDPINAPAYDLVMQEQAFNYYRGSNNTAQSKYYQQSWLEKLKAIQNDSKHVRLTPQGLFEHWFEERKGGFRLRNVRIDIHYLEEQLHTWSFVDVLEEISQLANDAERIELSRKILMVLKEKSYVNLGTAQIH